jgi:hypothetical protein
MKTALLICGWPRFSSEFDQQLANLQNSEIEWIVAFWKNFPNDVNDTIQACLNQSFVDTVKTEDQAKEWIQARMPENHKLVDFKFVDWNDFPTDLVGTYHNMVPRTWPDGIFRQFWMLKQVYSMVPLHGPYDLVIRSRGDLTLQDPLDLSKVLDQLRDDPMRIMIPSNGRQGLSFNDTFAVGRPQAIEVYASAVDYFNEVYSYGVTMHPENIVSYTLVAKDVHWEDDGIVAKVRQNGRFLYDTFIPGKQFYQPDLGRWA